MHINCCAKNCHNPVQYVCFCTNKANYLCSNHISNHYLGIHCIKNPYKLLNASNRGKFIYNFKKLKESEVASKTSILAAISQLNKDFALIIQELNTRIQVIESLIQDLMTQDSIILDLPEVYLENQLLTDEDIKYFMNSFQKTFEFEAILGRFNSSLDNINQTLKSNEILYFVKEYSREFVKFDLNLFEINKVLLDIDSSDLVQASFLKIDECTLFVSGGMESWNRYSEFDYLVNLITYKVKKIRTCYLRSNALPEKAFEKVFIFGGLFCDRYLTDSACLDLISSVWDPISLLPKELINTCPLALGDNILLSGFPHNFLQIYKIFDDFYIDLGGEFIIDLSNILIEYENSIFLVSEEIYKCEKKDLHVWKKIRRRPIKANNFVTKPIVKGNIAYFVDSDGFVYSFDLCDYKFQTLVQISTTSGEIN